MRQFEYIVDLIIAVVLMFIVPLTYFSQKSDEIVKTQAEVQTMAFMNEVKEKGYVSKDMYEKYQNKLSSTGYLYNIDLEHLTTHHEPEYILRDASDILEDYESKYGDTQLNQPPKPNTNIPDVYDPVYEGNLTEETNESSMAKADNKPADSGHVHGDSCYNGTKHVHSGNSSSGGGCYGKVNRHYHSGSSSSGGGCYGGRYTHSCWGSSTSGTGCYGGRYYHYHSSSCYHSHTSDCYSQYWCPGHISSNYSCTSCGATFHTTATIGARCGRRIKTLTCSRGGSTECGYYDGQVTGYYKNCGYYDGQTTGYYTTCGYSNGQITSYSINCGKTEGRYYDSNGNLASSICHQIVDTITPTHSTQTVYAGDPIVTTADIIFKDGSTKRVICTCSFNTSTIVTNRSVTINYTNPHDGKSYSVQIKVTTVPKSVTCTNGHTYNVNDEGKCPYCEAYVGSLSFITPSNGRLTMNRGSNLQKEGVKLKATYLDGKVQTLTAEDFFHNLDPYHVGVQTVTLSYKGKNITLQVTIKRNTERCDVCGRWYELYPNPNDPSKDINLGCPYCEARVPVFMGEVLSYTTKDYSANILDELYDGGGRYYLNQNDYIATSVKSKSKGWTQAIMRRLIGGQDTYIYTTQGGKVREQGASR